MGQRLRPRDLAILAEESSTTPMHNATVEVFDPGDSGFGYERLVELIEDRISFVPRYRQRVQSVPGRVANPEWLDDPSFDLAYHVRRSALPAPGSHDQLRELVARIISRPLDRQRPLWEVYLVEGLEGGRVAVLSKRADSLVVNPHKWLFTPIDCSAFYCRRPDVLKRAFSLVPSFLQTPEGTTVENYMDYGPQLGRRFRALKLWMVLRAYGRSGLQARLREHLRLAQAFADWVDADPDWERVAPVPFSTVCFRLRPRARAADDARLGPLNERLLEAVNATGEVYLSHAVLGGRYTLRLAIGNIRTEELHVRRAWEILRAEALRLRATPLVVA